MHTPAREVVVFEFLTTRLAAVKDALSESPFTSGLATLLAVVGVATTVPGLGASVFPSGGGGVEVRSVAPGSLAERIGLVAGDDLDVVNGQFTSGAKAVADALAANPKAPTLDVERQGKPIELGDARAPNGLGVEAVYRDGGDGALVEKVFAGSVAEKLGIHPGDQILRIDGMQIWDFRTRDFPTAIELSGHPAEIVVRQKTPLGERDVTFHADLGGHGPAANLLGFSFTPNADLSTVPLPKQDVWREGDPRWDRGWGRSGVALTDVRPGSPADKAGLRSGDVIYAFDIWPATDASSLQHAAYVSRESLDDTVEVHFVRAGERLSATVDYSYAALATTRGIVKAVAR